jgi:hypothetical protein
MADESTTENPTITEAAGTTATVTVDQPMDWDGHFDKPVIKDEDYEIPGSRTEPEPKIEEPAGDEKPAKPQAKETAGESADGKPEAAAAIPEALKSRAKEAGINDAELESFGDAAALERTLTLLDRADIRNHRTLREGQTNGNSQKPPEQPAPPAPPVAPPVQQQAPPPVTADDFQLDPEWVKGVSELDERIPKELQRLNDHYRTSRQRDQQALQAFQAELRSRDQQLKGIGDVVAQLMVGSELDKLAQDELWKPVLTESKNRQDIYEDATELAAVRQSRGQGPLPIQDLVRRAAMSRFGQDLHKQAVEKVRTQARDEGGRFSSSLPPQSREGSKQPDSREELFKRSRDLDKRMGLT